MRQSLCLLSLLSAGAIAQNSSGLSDSSLEKHVDTVTLSHSFNPVIPAYWTGYPHHRRTPFGVSPDGSTAYLAYLDSSGTGVHIQQINPNTFAAVGDAVTVSSGKEAGGLVAHDDGFAILTNEVSSSSGSDIPIPVIYRFKNGQQAWKTFIGGPGVDNNGSNASPDINGDLVFSETAGYYAAYIVVTAYEGWASGHFGDAIRYLDTDGNIKDINGASSSWGCSHNTGIAFEAADAPPYASICAEDQGAIWLNTKGQGMSTAGVKVSNELTINGGSNEPMGGMGGSYSALARFIGQDSYIFSWVSRGAVDISQNDWMGSGYTKSQARTDNRNVAIALFSDKNTLVGDQATSEVGAADGDSQINWVTEGSNDCSNAHAAAFDSSNALVTWEEIANPTCDFEAMGCSGKFAGTFYQLVNSKGEKVGSPVKSIDSFVAGDMVTMSAGRVCWPYVSMTWDLSGPARSTSSTNKMSFACISIDSGFPAPPQSASSSAVVSSAAQESSATASSSAPVEVVTGPDTPTTSDAATIPSSPPHESEISSTPATSESASEATDGVSPPLILEPTPVISASDGIETQASSIPEVESIQTSPSPPIRTSDTGVPTGPSTFISAARPTPTQGACHNAGRRRRGGRRGRRGSSKSI